MRPGITIIEEVAGTGAEATRDKTVLVNLRGLPIDETDATSPGAWHRTMIELDRREVNAGIRYGIEGMREGGRRIFSASPVLTACDRRLRYEVELLEVRDQPWPYLDCPPVMSVQVIHRGEMSRGLARWNFGLNEGGFYFCSVTPAVPGYKWKHLRAKQLQGTLEPARAEVLLRWIVEFPVKHPDETVPDIFNLGGDSPAYLDPRGQVVCLTIGISKGRDYSSYYVPETSSTWAGSEIQAFIDGLIRPAVNPPDHSARGRRLP